jgi:hypothetical protein
MILCYHYLNVYLKIAAIGILHEDTELLCFVVEERSFVFDDGGNVKRSQKSDLVEGILFVLLTQAIELH